MVLLNFIPLNLNCKYAIINEVMYSAIEKNKRNTIFIMIIFLALIGSMAWLYSYLYLGNNYSSVIFILIVAGIFAFVQYFLSSKLALTVTGAKEISKKDNPRLYRNR
jgi:heat shock protein HtpX